MKRILLQPAYVLHRRAYRESSFFVELFTKEHGRMTVIAKGVRKKKSPLQGLLQPFIPLLVSWVGKSELMILTQAETYGAITQLKGTCLYAGLYLNELLMGLLQKWDAQIKLYALYEETLFQLQKDILEQKTLRIFEKKLLEELGYGVLSKTDFSLQQTFLSDQYYQFIPGEGFILSKAHGKGRSNLFSGKSLLNIAKENWQDETSLQDAKRLMRLIFFSLLGGRLLHSRRLFQQLNAGETLSED